MFFGLNKGDLILIAAIGLVIIAMILIPRLLFEDESGIKAVIVTVDGTEVFREPMPQNTSGATRDFQFVINDREYAGVLEFVDDSVRLRRLDQEIVPLSIH